MEESSTAAEISVIGEITRFEKLRAIRWGLAYDIANTFFIQLTFFGSAFVLFLNDLNLNKSEIGLLLSIFPFFGLLSLVLNRQAARFGYKRTFLLSFGLRTFFAAGLLFVPAIANRVGVNSIWIFIVAITVGFAISRASAMTALLPWQQEYIPNESAAGIPLPAVCWSVFQAWWR